MSLPPAGPNRPFAKIDDAGYYLTSTGLRSHFHVSEFTCHDGCGRHDMDQQTVDVAERIRARFNVPVLPNCGIRCEAHNTAVGGKPLSQHLPRTERGEIVKGVAPGGAGRAFDFNLKGWTPFETYRAIDKEAHALGVVGLGRYPGFVHVDTRTGPPARWQEVA